MIGRILTAKVQKKEDGQIVLLSPEVGQWHNRPFADQILQPGEQLGYIQRLSCRYPIIVPVGVSGRAIQTHPTGSASISVGYGSPLLQLHPITEATAAGETGQTQPAATETDQPGLILPTPMSGRYYGRLRPTEAPFIEVGAVIETGRTVALIEVMKTFNRVVYDGPSHGLPSPAKVIAIFPAEDEDVARGAPLIQVEPA